MAAATKRSASLGLAFYYFALFAGIGVHLPFWPLWLKERGLDAAQIGLVVAATYLARVLFNPVIGHLADHGLPRKPMMMALAWGAAASWVLYSVTDSFYPILILTLVSTGLWAGLMPLGDGLSLRCNAHLGVDYGRVRLWGSISFILAAITMGKILPMVGSDQLIWIISGLLILTAISCYFLPNTPGSDSRHAPPPPISHLLKSRFFLLFLAATSLNQAAHTLYYAFASIHWKDAGHSDAIIGLLWSEGVLAEIALFLLSAPLASRLGASRLLLLAAVGGMIRWSVLGTTTWLPALFAAQILHAATFGCSHLGAMKFLQRHISHDLSSRAQALYAALAVGLAPGLMSPIAGWLYHQFGGVSFFLMSALSLGAFAIFWRISRWR